MDGADSLTPSASEILSKLGELTGLDELGAIHDVEVTDAHDLPHSRRLTPGVGKLRI